MANCKWCGCSGEVLDVTEDGLCSACEPVVSMEINNRLRMINRCKKLVGESEKLDEQLEECDNLVEHAEALVEYEERGIPTIEPSASELVRTYREGRDDLIVKGAEREAENALAAAEVFANADTKVSQLSKMVLKIQEYKAKLHKAGRLDALEQRMAELTHQTQLKGYLEEAREAKIKGRHRRALELYNYALHLLESEVVSEALRQDNLPAVEAKIAELIALEQGEEEEEEKEEEQEEGETE